MAGAKTLVADGCGGSGRCPAVGFGLSRGLALDRELSGCVLDMACCVPDMVQRVGRLMAWAWMARASVAAARFVA